MSANPASWTAFWDWAWLLASIALKLCEGELDLGSTTLDGPGLGWCRNLAAHWEGLVSPAVSHFRIAFV